MAELLPIGDAFFLLTESANTPNQVGVLVRLKLPKGAKRSFVADLFQSFRRHPVTEAPFNLRLAKGYFSSIAPAWETDENVDLDYHLRHSALAYPGGERELAVLISRLHSIPLDHHRPMWEFHMIEGLDHRSFAIYMKMHHALVDGVAGARMISRWTSKSRERTEEFRPMWAMPRPAETVREHAPDPAGQVHSMFEQITDPLKSVFGVVGAAIQTVRGSQSGSLEGLVGPYDCPETLLNVAVGPQRRVSTVDFKISRIRAVAKALGGTLNDVVMAVSGGALRRYLLELDALPDKPLTAQVPVSFRPKGDVRAGNAIGMVLCSLATHRSDPQERFDGVRQSMIAAKTLLRDMDATQIMGYSAALTLPFAIGQMTGLGNRSKFPMFNVVISNVPGPQERRYLNGAEVLSIQPISFVLQGQALNITLFSYADEISFVYTACRESLPGVQKLVSFTQDAVEELERVVGTSGTVVDIASRKKAAGNT